MSVESTIKARQKRKSDLVYIMGGKCVLCGYDKCQQALEFHHIDKTKKKYSLSSGNCRSWEEDIEEVKKCALVCSNCHKEIEVFNYTVKNTFDNDKYQELNEKRKLLDHKCKICGKDISKGATYCPECWSILNRRVERPTREELKSLIRNESFSSIGRQYGVTDNSIRKWCDDYSLPRRKKDISNISDEEWEKI